MTLKTNVCFIRCEKRTFCFVSYKWRPFPNNLGWLEISYVRRTPQTEQFYQQAAIMFYVCLGVKTKLFGHKAFIILSGFRPPRLYLDSKGPGIPTTNCRTQVPCFIDVFGPSAASGRARLDHRFTASRPVVVDSRRFSRDNKGAA